MIHGCARRWEAKLRHMKALSTTEAEYMTLTDTVKESIWLKGHSTESGAELRYIASIATGDLTMAGQGVPARFDIEKFDGKNDFGLWQIKMRALMVQQGCDVALETLPADMEAGEKAALMKKAYSTKLGDHIDEFNKLILDLANIDIEIEDEDQALMLLTSLTSSYENLMETLLYGRESLTMDDVLATRNSRELKKRTEGTKKEAGYGLYVRGMSDYSGKAHSGGSSPFKSKGRTGKLKFFICHSEGHLKRDCLKKKSSGFVKKGKRDQNSDSSDDEGNAYFGEALLVVENDEITELVMDSGGFYHMTHRRDFLYDFKVVDGGSVQLGNTRTCTIKGTGKMKIHWHNGSSFILEDVRYVPRLRRSLISLGTLEKEGYTVKMQMGRIKVELHGAQGNREDEVFHVSNDDAAVAQRQLEDKQLEEKTNTDCLVNEQEKVHLGIKVAANITVTGVPGQEGAEGNVAKKKKMKESMETNIGKLLKYNAWSTRWSPIRGSSTRKRC
ncbi:zinc finger, CCHC-type containing protein [Tanacetum coccineum]